MRKATQLSLLCLLVVGIGFAAPPAQTFDDDILTADEYVLAVWITQGILLDVQTVEEDLFAFTLKYREEMSGHPLRSYLQDIDGMELQSAKSSPDHVTREIYHLRTPAPDVDGPTEDMPDLVGRLIRDGHRRVVDEFGRPVLYTAADFEDAPQIQASSYYRELMVEHGGDAMAFMRRLASHDMLARTLFAEYEGVDVPRLNRLVVSREWPGCFNTVGSCSFGSPPLRLVDPLVDHLLWPKMEGLTNVMRKSDGLELSGAHP